MNKIIQIAILIILVAGCSVMTQLELNREYGEPKTINREAKTKVGFDFAKDARSVFNNRCVVCHSCLDAPCQTKLSSFEGIDRGSNPEEVYAGERLLAIEPTRLFIDADSTQKWRNKGFSPILNERQQTPENNLKLSLLYQLLEMKEDHPATEKLLPKSFDLGINREQQCPTIETLESYKSNFPLWGMPYALPKISEDEKNKIKTWLEHGAPIPPSAPLSEFQEKNIIVWENFLNGTSNKKQLMSRYLFEHLFQAHLYFVRKEDSNNKVAPTIFYRLVRSKTASGKPIEIIATRRAFDSPGKEKFYYRLWQEKETIVAKDHMPYSLDTNRKKFWEKLFLNDSYQVENLPSYEPKKASNPFTTFRDIPIRSRYSFLLSEAEFTILGFIKGPVCRGNTALNAIDDRFWVMFMDPNLEIYDHLNDFLIQEEGHLRLPIESQINTFDLTSYLRYSLLQENYLKAKKKFFENSSSLEPKEMRHTIWDGDNENKNASLTIFRHGDSASIAKGFIGKTPKTAWLIGYPLLERLHYLLVSGFDVFSNVGYQLNTRLYMDFLRMEGEDNFLALLPPESRVAEKNYWYRDDHNHIIDHIYSPLKSNIEENPNYSPKQKEDLLNNIKVHLGSALLKREEIPSALKQLQDVTGENATPFPQVSILSVKSNDNKITSNKVYTILRDTGYSNLSTPFCEEHRRLPKEDTLTVAPGIHGNYPNAFFEITEDQLFEFSRNTKNVSNKKSYYDLLTTYGVRRTDPNFWEFSDKLIEHYKKTQPIKAGILDYNRLENR